MALFLLGLALSVMCVLMIMFDVPYHASKANWTCKDKKGIMDKQVCMARTAAAFSSVVLVSMLMVTMYVGRSGK